MRRQLQRLARLVFDPHFDRHQIIGADGKFLSDAQAIGERFLRLHDVAVLCHPEKAVTLDSFGAEHRHDWNGRGTVNVDTVCRRGGFLPASDYFGIIF